MRLASLFIFPLIAVGAVAQILQRDFAIQGCIGLTTILNPTLGIAGSALTGLFTTESACAVSTTKRCPCFAH